MSDSHCCGGKKQKTTTQNNLKTSVILIQNNLFFSISRRDLWTEAKILFNLGKTTSVTPAFSSLELPFCKKKVQFALLDPHFLLYFAFFFLWIKFHSCNQAIKHCSISSNLSEKLNNHSHLSPLSVADSHFIPLNLSSSNWPRFSSSHLVPSWLPQDTLAPADFNPHSTSSDTQEVFQTGGNPGNNNNVQATYSPQEQELEHWVSRQWDINRTRFEASKALWFTLVPKEQ